MTLQKRRTFILVASFIVALGIGGYALVMNNAPKLGYSIVELEPGSKEEIPMQITKGVDSLEFVTRFVEHEGKIKSAKLGSGISFKTTPPFVLYGQDLNITLSGVSALIDEEKDVLYEIKGEIVNLKPVFYKIRIYDGFGNLIDEQAVDFSVVE